MNYIFSTSWPQHDEFLGLYETPTGYKHIVLKYAKEPMGPFRLITTDGGPPHFVHDPIAWAPLPVVSETARRPIEHAVARMRAAKIPPDMMDRLEKQKAEFDTLDALVDALKALPPVVDDDYPEARHRYDKRLRVFLNACNANGRLHEIEFKKERS